MKEKNRKTMVIIFISYLFVGIIAIGIGIGGVIYVDIKMDRDYQGYYYLAESAGSPEAISDLLDQYLTAVEDVHGYAALIWKNPSTDMDFQKQIVQSFKDRADDLCDLKELSKQRIDVQLSFVELTEDMQEKELPLIGWYILHHATWILNAYLFLCFVWWWTFLWVWHMYDKSFYG